MSAKQRLAVGRTVLSFAAATMGSMPALAQSGTDAEIARQATAEQGAADQPIIVTARRRAERITDIPAAVDVIGQREIDDQGGLITLEDIAANIPSTNFDATTTPATAEISMRGSGTARSTNAEGGVGLYRNGTFVGGGRRGGRSFTRMDFFDLDRVEVLRGVQGALYGRNAVGGALNLVNTQPQFELGGFFRGGFAQWERAEVQAVVNLPLSETVAVRIGGDLMEQGSGAFFNTFTNRYFDDQRARGLRGQVRVRTGPLDATLMLETSHAELPPLVFALNIQPTANFPNGVFQDPYNFGWNGNSVATQKQRSAILNASLDLGFATLSTSASIRQRNTDHGFDSDGLDPIFLAELRAGGGGLTTDAFQDTLQLDRTRNNYIEVHLTDKGATPLTWMLGYEHVEIRSASRFSNTRTPTRTNRSPGSVAITQLNTTGNAVFGLLGYDFTDRLGTSGELRYTREEKSLVSDRIDLGTGSSLGPRYNFDVADSEDNVSWTATLSYKFPSIGGLAYARVGTGFRAGGFNDDLGDPRAPNPVIPSFDSETVVAYEVGFKGRIIDPVNLSAALYQTDGSDSLIQVSNGCGINVPACPVGPTIFLVNGKTSRVRGAEGQVVSNFELGEARLRLSGSIGYIDARITSGPDAGRQIPQVPNWMFTANANLTFPVGDDIRGFGNLLYNSRSGGVQEIDQVPPLVSFYRIDARAGLRLRGFEFAVFADNITDKRYDLFATNTTRRANMPRRFGAEVTKRW